MAQRARSAGLRVGQPGSVIIARARPAHERIAIPQQRPLPGPVNRAPRPVVPTDQPYDRWTAVLGELFFGLDKAGQTVVVFVDDRLLDDLQQAGEAPDSSLIEAVRAQLGSPKKLLDPVLSRVAAWRKGPAGAVPPYLPLLAVTVLAASRMAESDKLDGHNYYGRLAPILGCTPSAIEDHFDVIAGWWKDLDAWLQRSEGSRGISTIVEHPRLKKIGYPLSQALVRESDRRTLRQFFKRAGVDRRPVPGKELAAALVNWATDGRSGLSARFRSLIAAPGERALLARILEAEAQAWDGVTIDTPTKPKDLPARLLFQPRRERVLWVAELPDKASGEQALGSCRGVKVTEAGGGRFLRIESPQFRAQDLIGGFTLTGSRRLVRWTGRRATPMVMDPNLDGWVSVSRLSMDEKQLLLVADPDWSDLESYLRDSGIPFQHMTGVPGLQGLQLAQFPARAVDARADAGREMPGALAAVWPESVVRPGLRGGLMLKPGSGQRTYLVGGAPDLYVPAGLQPRSAELSAGGETTAHAVDGETLSLSDLAVSPGNYTVSVAGAEFPFRLVESSGLLHAPDAGGIGWTGEGATVSWQPARLQPEVQADAVRGAAVAEPPPSLVRTIRTGGCSTLFLVGDNPGELQRIQVPKGSPHGELFGCTRAGSVQAVLSFVPTWIVRDWSERGARPRAKASPVEFTLPPAGIAVTAAPTPHEIARWCDEIKRLSAASTDTRWQKLALRSWAAR